MRLAGLIWFSGAAFGNRLRHHHVIGRRSGKPGLIKPGFVMVNVTFVLDCMDFQPNPLCHELVTPRCYHLVCKRVLRANAMRPSACDPIRVSLIMWRSAKSNEGLFAGVPLADPVRSCEAASSSNRFYSRVRAMIPISVVRYSCRDQVNCNCIRCLDARAVRL